MWSSWCVVAAIALVPASGKDPDARAEAMSVAVDVVVDGQHRKPLEAYVRCHRAGVQIRTGPPGCAGVQFTYEYPS